MIPKFSVLSRYGALVLVSLVIHFRVVEAGRQRGGSGKGSSPPRENTPSNNVRSPSRGCPSPSESQCREAIENLLKMPSGTCAGYSPETCAKLEADGHLEQCKCSKPGHKCRTADGCTEIPQCTVEMLQQTYPEVISSIRGPNGKLSWKAVAAAASKVTRINSIASAALAKAPTFGRTLTGSMRKLGSLTRYVSRSGSKSGSKSSKSTPRQDSWLSGGSPPRN